MKPTELREAIDEKLRVMQQHFEDHHPDPDMTQPCGIVIDVRDAILDAVISSLPEEQDAYRDGSDVSKFAGGYNTAISEIRFLLQQAKTPASKESE